ncbi:MAG: hypothetical protein OEL88_10835 [Sterolibacteriaceae bacterium MAG5]|nr:hypothetical protein [Candidatus Nitricoxidireducens bremensis]
MNEAHPALAEDALAALASPDVQRQAARMAQDAFGQAFRLTLTADDAGRREGIDKIAAQLRNWARAGDGDEARSLRLALLVSGMDQWGLAYAQAFEIAALPGLTELLGGLRTELDERQEADFERKFAALQAAETNGVDFKVELRRGIHLALWHAMIASEEEVEAKRILNSLGSMMLALIQTMPQVGWRLVADALAHIQIRCLAEALAGEGLARETTEGLFGALSQALPKETRDKVFAYSTQAVLAWQQARRQPAPTAH